MIGNNSRFTIMTGLIISLIISNSSPSLALMSFNPLSIEKSTPSESIVDKMSIATDNFPECSPVPKLKDISGSFEYHSSLLTFSEAIKLEYSGLFSGNADGNQMLLVQDYVRGTECLATDNKTKLLYGQTIRTIIKLSDWNAKLGASLPIIAADATMNKKNHQFHIYSIGIENKDIPNIIADISNKDFDVTNYSTFREVEGKLIRLINNNNTTQSVKRLGIVPSKSDDSIKNAVVIALALQNIKKEIRVMTLKPL